jgi:hypothetical protein
MNALTIHLWDDLTDIQKQKVAHEIPAIAQWRVVRRARSSAVAVAWRSVEIVAAVAISHERISVDGVLVDVAVVRHTFCHDGEEFAVIVETLMNQALTLLEEGIGIILVHGDVAEWLPFGFAPISHVSHIVQAGAPTHSVHTQATMQIPSDSEWQTITSMAMLQHRNGVALYDVAHPQRAPWVMLTGRDGQLRAAANVVCDQHSCRLVAAVASDDGAAYDLVQQLWYTPLLAHKPTIQLGLDHPLTRAALAQYGVVTVQSAAAHGMLAGVIDLPTMLNALAPVFAKRLRQSVYADWSGGVRIEISDERAMLMIDHSQVSVIDGTREADVRLKQVDVAALAQLAFGYRSVALLRRFGMVMCDDTELALFDILFPARTPVFVLDE